MVKTKVQWRAWYKGMPPQPIKLQIPGWAGLAVGHGDGAAAQPWHCPPFVDGSVYGLELIYPFDSECYVCLRNGKIHFDGDFTQETSAFLNGPPFKEFAPHHYGFTSSLDLLVNEDMVVRIEPHPRYYTDLAGDCPCPVPGHIHTAFWPKIFFVVFKAPLPGQTHAFRKGEPYAQILVLPRKVQYEIKEMSEEESKARQRMSDDVVRCKDELARHKWVDNVGNHFDDKYKVLQTAFLKGGKPGVDAELAKAGEVLRLKKEKSDSKKKRFKRRLVATRDETLSHQQKAPPSFDLRFGDSGVPEEAPNLQAANHREASAEDAEEGVPRPED
jgi:hypothetical protein